ncbi:MAG: winged helix-turn-helix transcriptional regulator [Halobacteriaceae archaeon]
MSSQQAAEPKTGTGIEACAVIDGLEQIGSQWRLAVLHALQGGEMRFNELQRETDASSRTLSRVLDHLQDAELVTRRVETESPLATYYSLTPKGEALGPVFEAVESWAETWLAACEEQATAD